MVPVDMLRLLRQAWLWISSEVEFQVFEHWYSLAYDG